jgi:hypothetical protein
LNTSFLILRKRGAKVRNAKGSERIAIETIRTSNLEILPLSRAARTITREMKIS